MILPFTNNPEESFSVPIFDIVYNFRQLWSEYGFWVLDISSAENVVLVHGVKIITGEFLLRQYPQIPFDLKSISEADPGRNNLDIFPLEVTSKDV